MRRKYRMKTLTGIGDEICCSVIQSCPTLCSPRDCSTPGFPVLHYLSEFAQIHIHWVGDAIQPSHPLLSVTFSSCLQYFPASGSFPMSQLFTSGGQSIGASASVLPMSIQGWFPLGLTGLISLQSKRLSRVFSSTTVGKHQFFGACSAFFMVQLSYSCKTTRKNIALTIYAFVGQVSKYVIAIPIWENFSLAWKRSSIWWFLLLSPF